MTNQLRSGGDDDYKDISKGEVHSDVHLEDDTGHGGAAIIRSFTFGVNREAFKNYPPTKQNLFNAHLKQIEIALWGDGMKIMTDVQPSIKFNKKKTQYTIIIGAKPQKGHLLLQTPKLLKELVNP